MTLSWKNWQNMASEIGTRKKCKGNKPIAWLRTRCKTSTIIGKGGQKSKKERKEGIRHRCLFLSLQNRKDICKGSCTAHITHVRISQIWAYTSLYSHHQVLNLTSCPIEPSASSCCPSSCPCPSPWLILTPGCGKYNMPLNTHYKFYTYLCKLMFLHTLYIYIYSFFV
jgi:hypothetical protein